MINPDSLIQAVATIVGLLCNFKQEKSAKEDLDHRKFVEWLEYHKHEDLKHLILQTHYLPREIDELLRKDQKEILNHLKELNGVFASILSKLDGFSGLINAMVPGIGISDQAKKILVSFADSDAEFLCLMDMQGESFLLFAPGNGRDVPEPRFLPDDVNVLAGYGLIALDFGGGDLRYRLTRNGANFAKALKAQGITGGI